MVSFQGQIFGNVPIIKPVKNIRVKSRNLRSNHDNRCEKDSKPITQPDKNSANVSTWKPFTAANTGAYIPINNKIKLPEIPGKIIAQIAIAPANSVLMAVGSMCRGLSTVML